MKRKKLIYSKFKVGFNAEEDSDEYVYDDDVKRDKPSKGGTRLVGARTDKGGEAPFVVAINTQGLVLSLTFSISIIISAEQ